MPNPRSPHLIVASIAVTLLLVLVACTATRARRGAPQKSGFLGDYSQLEKRDGYPMSLVYINPDVDFTLYDSISIDSVTLWVTEETSARPEEKRKLSEKDRQMLTDLLYEALYEELGRYFVIADHPSHSTIRLRAALTQTKGANVPLRTLTTVVPQLRAATSLGGLSADVAYTVGKATVEIEVVDSITGERLAASVDQRAGNKALLTTRTFTKWGDVEAAAQFWARRVAYRAATHGVQRKPGAPMPDPKGGRTF